MKGRITARLSLEKKMQKERTQIFYTILFLFIFTFCRIGKQVTSMKKLKKIGNEKSGCLNFSLQKQ